MSRISLAKPRSERPITLKLSEDHGRMLLLILRFAGRFWNATGERYPYRLFGNSCSASRYKETGENIQYLHNILASELEDSVCKLQSNGEQRA
jgi:hypothetical protein